MTLLRGLVVWMLCASAVLADERILSFNDTVTVQNDGSLKVREIIRVRAEGRNIRRGIYRDFPTTYPGNGRQIVVGFAFESATRDGHDEPWRAEPLGNGVRVYLGSASVMLPVGEHTYELVYRTDRQMGFRSDHDELYWNVTGNGWEFPIDRATARIVLPADIPVGDIKLEAYTGAQGAKDANYTATIDQGAPLFSTTRGLGPREGLTIVAMWPKGFITAAVEESVSAMTGPTSSPGYDHSQDAGNAASSGRSPIEAMLNRDLRKSTLPAFLGLFGLAALLLYYYRTWLKVGRDPPSRITIPEYESPKGQSPASMRYLMHMGYDNDCFAAAVLSLAVKGYLHIQQESGVLGIGKKFTLVKQSNPAAKPLSADEEQLLINLFSEGDTLVLEQESHERVSEARTNHRLSLKERYTSGFFRINGGWHFLGIVLSILLALPALLLPGKTHLWPEWHFTTPAGWFTLITVVLMFVANGVFGKLLRAPTVAGQAAMDHIRGFRMYLEVAEGEDLKRVKAPPPLTPQLFESYLPAALALGVEQRWAERFSKILDVQAPDYSPAWYVGPAWNIRDIGGFSSNLGSSLSSAISSSSTAPGSSSGGGGGGSSGGGGGGGGGGGW